MAPHCSHDLHVDIHVELLIHPRRCQRWPDTGVRTQSRDRAKPGADTHVCGRARSFYQILHEAMISPQHTNKNCVSHHTFCPQAYSQSPEQCLPRVHRCSFSVHSNQQLLPWVRHSPVRGILMGQSRCQYFTHEDWPLKMLSNDIQEYKEYSMNILLPRT